MSLEEMKINAELLRVSAAKADMEINIMERMADIARLELNIETQNKRLQELNKKLSELKGK